MTRFTKVRLSLPVFALLAFGCACGGGGSNSSLPSQPQATPTFTPTPNASSSPQSGSSSFIAQANPTSVPLPSVGGFSGTLNLPGIIGLGTVTLGVSTTAPAGAATIQSHVRSTKRRDQSSNPVNTALLYFTLTPTQSITLQGPPGFALTLPSNVSVAGSNTYAAYYQQAWVATSGAAVVNGSTVSVPATSAPSQRIPIAAGQTAYFAAFDTGTASISIALSSPLVMGSPSKVNVTARPFDEFGSQIIGSLPQPIAITSDDSSGRSVLGSASISNTSQTASLTYSGKGERFTLTANQGAVSAQQSFITILEKEQLVSGVTQAGLSAFGKLILGPDGNFWTIYGGSIYQVTPAGQAKSFSDPNANHAYQGGGSIVVGSDGNLWLPYLNSSTNAGGISRMTTSGSFTSFDFSGQLRTTDATAGELVLGPDGAVWFTVGPVDAYLPGAGIARIDSSGNITEPGPLSSTPMNLVVGPDNNFWFALGSNVDKMTPAGTVTSYSLPGSTNGGLMHFIVGPDGNFWAPFAYGSKTLLKFSTSGTVVSNSPLSYTTPWDFANGTNTVVPLIGNMVVDSSALFLTDSNTEGVLRIDSGGGLSAYPTYSTLTNIVDDSLYLVRGANGGLYLSSTAILNLTQAGMVQALTPLDASLW